MGRMQHFHYTLNFGGPSHVRRVTKGGREWLVAPMTTIVPGVLNGSKGALLYRPADIQKSIPAWNRIPITIYHPIAANGQHVSASSPGILHRQGVGYLSSSAWKGKLVHEGWFDVNRLKQVDERVLNALERGEPMELSTGLYTDNIPEEGVFNGRPYQYVAKNYIPDHLAILPDQVGACSRNDGCGLLINANPTGINQYTKRGEVALESSKEAKSKLGVALAEKALTAIKAGKLEEAAKHHIRARDEHTRAGDAYEGSTIKHSNAAADHGNNADHILRGLKIPYKKFLKTMTDNNERSNMALPTQKQVNNAIAVLNALQRGQATRNAKKKTCPECGGELDEDGECEECGYVENSNTGVHQTSQTNGEGMFNVNASPPGHLADAPRAQVQAAMAAMAEEGGGGKETGEAVRASKKADSSGKAKDHKVAAAAHSEAAEHHRDEGNDDFASAHSNMARMHTQKAKGTNNMTNWRQILIGNSSPPGHLSGAPREQVQAAMAAMAEEGGGGTGGGSHSKEAFSAGKKADKSGKSSDHKAAASAHKEAAEHHKESGNSEMSKVHSDMARSHTQKAKHVANGARGEGWLKGLIENCSCQSTANELQRVLNERTTQNADDDNDGDEDEDEYPVPQMGKKKKDMSTNQWLQQQPREVQETFQDAHKVVQGKKAAIVRKLTSNLAHDPDKQVSRQQQLMAKGLNELQGILELVGNQGAQPPQATFDPLPIFGADNGFVENAGGPDDILDVPVMNWGRQKTA